GETFRALAESWGVVVPLGEQPAIGMGGHVAGGAFGFLCRQLGLAADYLHAVEAVTVDEGGRASRVVATRETSDPTQGPRSSHTRDRADNPSLVTRPSIPATSPSGKTPAAPFPNATESI